MCVSLFCMCLGSACLPAVSGTTEALLSAKLCGTRRFTFALLQSDTGCTRVHKNVVKIRPPTQDI